jgi:uncharacterized protein
LTPPALYANGSTCPKWQNDTSLKRARMKIEPFTTTGRPLISAFGAGGFRFGLQTGDLRIEGGVLILADTPQPWEVVRMSDLVEAHMTAVLALQGQIEFFLLGTGDRLTPPPAFLRPALRGHGIGLELMETATACRAYNHLATEGRHFAAALLPVGTTPA